MEIRNNNHRTLREAFTGEAIFRTESQPVGPSSTSPEEVLRVMEENTIARYGIEAARLAFSQCFPDLETQALFSSRYGGPPQTASA